MVTGADVPLPTIRYVPGATWVPGQFGFAWPGWKVPASTGQVSIDVPRDREGTFEPQVIRQRRPGGAGQVVLSLYAKGLTTGNIRQWMRNG